MCCDTYVSEPGDFLLFTLKTQPHRKLKELRTLKVPLMKKNVKLQTLRREQILNIFYV